MLEDKLDNARKQNAARRRYLTFGLIVAGMLVVAILVIASGQPLNQTSDQIKSALTTQDVTPDNSDNLANIAPIAPNPPLTPQPKPALSTAGELEAEPTSDLTSLSTPAPPPPPKQIDEGTQSDLSELDQGQLRKDFKDRLKSYTNQYEAALNDANLMAWAKEQVLDLQHIKKQAVNSFSSGAYQEGISQLQRLEIKTVDILAQKDQIYKTSFTQAEAFFENDQYDHAKLNIDKALMVSPNDLAALDLQERINTLPKLIGLLEEAKIAQRENNLQKEYDILKQIKQLAPDREHIISDLALVKKAIADRDFSQYITQGLRHVEASSPQKARKQLANAKHVYPSRSEVKTLAQDIENLERKLRLAEALKKAKAAIRQDNWLAVQTHYKQAQKDAPNNQSIVEGLALAKEILSLKSTLKAFADNPYRLNNPALRQSVKSTLTQAEDMSQYSFSLKQQSEAMALLNDKLNTPIAITISSDNLTNILVRQVGKVGVIKEKTIYLKPGTYQFEGLRMGYKSKLIKVLIPYDKTSFKIEIICNERI